MRAHSGAALRDLLEAELGPYNNHDGKVGLDGPDLRFTERALTFLALLFHELATNAANCVHAAASVSEALSILEREVIDVALLDVNVGNETSIPVARVLSERGLPFVFATGYGAQTTIIEEFPSIPVLQKPYAMPQAVAILSKAFCER